MQWKLDSQQRTRPLNPHSRSEESSREWLAMGETGCWGPSSDLDPAHPGSGRAVVGHLEEPQRSGGHIPISPAHSFPSAHRLVSWATRRGPAHALVSAETNRSIWDPETPSTPTHSLLPAQRSNVGNTSHKCAHWSLLAGSRARCVPEITEKAPGLAGTAVARSASSGHLLTVCQG